MIDDSAMHNPMNTGTFPAKFRSSQGASWPAGLALPRQDDNLLRLRLDRYWDEFQRTSLDVEGQPAVRFLTAFVAELSRESDLRSMLRILLLIDAPLHDHPAIVQHRLNTYKLLHATPQLEAEFRRAAKLFKGKKTMMDRLADMADNSGLRWRLGDVFPSSWQPELLVGESHLAWLHRNGSPEIGNHKTTKMRARMLAAYGLPPTARLLNKFERADRVFNGYKVLLKSARTAALWPDDAAGQKISDFHQTVVDSVVDFDLGILREARDKDLSLILLFSHVGPTTGMNKLDLDLDLPVTLIANNVATSNGFNNFLTFGTSAELAFKFLALAKKMGREQTTLLVFPDGGSGRSQITVDVRGMPIDIGLGAAALARRRPSQLFYVRTLVKENNISWQIEPGPILGPEIEQELAEKQFAAFYAKHLEKHLRCPPSEIGTPRFQLAHNPTVKT